jgi:hypothetical protein
MHYSSGPGVIPHPLPEVNFLMVEIPTPIPYIFMIRVTSHGQSLVKIDKMVSEICVILKKNYVRGWG